jgi:hypothetical protein
MAVEVQGCQLPDVATAAIPPARSFMSDQVGQS